jgi:hypothetical protein
MAVLQLLSGIGGYHLGLAELSQGRTLASQPALGDATQAVLDGLAKAIRGEIEMFVLSAEEHP